MKNRGIILLLCILVLVLGFFGYLLANSDLTNSKKYEREITEVETVTETDETADIEEDLDATDIDSTDQELLQIETELNSNP